MLGDRIAALRKNAGFSQAELAEMIGVSPSTVGMYEQCRREPALDMLVKLSETFHVSTDYLLTGKVRLPDADLEALCMQVLANRRKRKKPVLTEDELTVLMAAVLTEG